MKDRDAFKPSRTGKDSIPLRSKIITGALAVIPDRVDNRTIIRVFEALRKQQQLSKHDYSRHSAENRKSFRQHKAVIAGNGGFIEDQNSYTDISYGASTVQYSGCELIALYNALHSLGDDAYTDLPDIVSDFEKDGMVFRGKFGTSPKALADYLEKRGYTAELITEVSGFDKLAHGSDCLILTIYNDGLDISKEVHTVCVSKAGGGYTAHNVYSDGKPFGPFPSVSELTAGINSGRAKGISLIGIRKK